jgi:hypothetical protein
MQRGLPELRRRAAESLTKGGSEMTVAREAQAYAEGGEVIILRKEIQHHESDSVWQTHLPLRPGEGHEAWTFTFMSDGKQRSERILKMTRLICGLYNARNHPV